MSNRLHTLKLHGASWSRLIEWVSKKGAIQWKTRCETDSQLKQIFHQLSLQNKPKQKIFLNIFSERTFHSKTKRSFQEQSSSLSTQSKGESQYSPITSIRVSFTETNCWWTGATSAVQWRTMRVCLSAAKRKRSRDGGRASQQAAAHMGGGEEKGGLSNSHLANSERVLVFGSPCLGLSPLLTKKCLKKYQISHLF